MADEEDCDITTVAKKALYYTDFGTPCLYMNEIEEKHFQVCSESDLSSCDECDNHSEPLIIKEIFAEETSTNITENKKQKKTKTISNNSNMSQSDSESEDQPHKKLRIKRNITEVTSRISNLSSQNKKKKTNTISINSDSDSESERHKKLRKKGNDMKVDVFEKYKFTRGIDAIFNEYFCNICKVTMSSLAGLKIHKIGKRHVKALRNKKISEVALESLPSMKNERDKIKVPPEASMRFLSTQEPTHGRCYPLTPPGMRRIETYKTSFIQAVADSYRRGPVPGLGNVIEIRHINLKVNYYCRVCNTLGSHISIMPHLTGFKHLLLSLKEIDPRSYGKYILRRRQDIEHKVLRLHANHERRFGRGLIKVFEEIYSNEFQTEFDSRNDEPSYLNDYQDDMSDMKFVSSPEYLDTSQNDFRCKLCDAHMNNKSMWETHIIGKRHIKNEKKFPGEAASKLKSFPCPEETAHLMDLLYDVRNEPIVGLSFIRETQSKAGFLYNCFLCGACNSDYDIVEHLLTTKHKTKYLEAANKEKKKNSIEEIKLMQDISPFYKDSLINEQCERILRKYGSGKVSVYKMKRNGW